MTLLLEIMIIKSRKSNRLKNYNYSQAGYYFVTLCSKDGKQWFGKIKNEKMQPYAYGEVVAKFWQEMPKYYSNICLDKWIVMPNHLHGIVIINDMWMEQCDLGTEQCSVPTNRYGLLSKAIKSFKEFTVKTIHKQHHNNEFSWQRSFYDHIIRDNHSLYRIREYIQNNPLKWALDKNNPKNRNTL